MRAFYPVLGAMKLSAELGYTTGGVHVAFFAGVLGLGAWYGRRWQGVGCTLILGCCGVAAMLGYIGLCLVSQTVAQHLFARALGPQITTDERLAILPLPGWGPMQWRGIAVTRSAYLVSRVTLVPPSVTPPEVIAKGPDTPLVRALGPPAWCACFGTVPAFLWSKPPHVTLHSSSALWTSGPRATAAPKLGLPSWCGSMRRATCRRLSFSTASFCRPHQTFERKDSCR
jgi:hypothetical protein